MSRSSFRRSDFFWASADVALGPRRVRAEEADEPLEEDRVLEAAVGQDVLQRGDVPLRHGLPVVAHVGHVNEDEPEPAFDELILNGVKQVRLAGPAAAGEEPAERVAVRGADPHLLGFGQELVPGVLVHVGHVADGRRPDVLEPDGPVEVGLLERAQGGVGREGVHDGMPP